MTTTTPPRTHGVREFHHNDDADDFAVEEIRTVGYTLVDSGLSEEDLALIREKVARIYRMQIEEVGGEDNLKAMNDADIARALVGYDDYFLGIAAHPRIMSICRRMLGEKFVLMSQNAIINRPTDAHYQLTWHRDLNYQHFTSSRPLALSALYCVDPFNEETGGTYLLPASHKIEEFPSPEYTEKHKIVLNAKPGAILIFDAMIYHRAGQNRSNITRIALNHIYTLPLIKQQIDLPHMLGGRHSDDPFMKTFLGYDSQTGPDVQRWREGKLTAAGILKPETVHAG